MDSEVPHISPHTPSSSGRPSIGKRISAVLLIIVLCVAAGFGGSWLFSLLSSGEGQSTVTDRAIDTSGNTIATDSEEMIAAVADKVSPSVVSIVTTASVRSYYGTRSEASGAGTGIIVSKDGYVMTNSHVIDGADGVSVILSNGTTYEDVTVIGRDPLNDIAFLKIKGVNDLKAAELGDSSKLRIGQTVVAIGNALGQFQTTVTSGIVSATGRPIVAASQGGSNAETLSDLIQTDAAINSGNSGGPLVDISGRVIGINTAVATDANGIGFAIPINSTRGVLRGVLETGKISRAYLGVQYVDITADIATAEELPVRQGAYVQSSRGDAVVKGSPAEKAGIKTGDILLKINDEVIGESANMSSILGQYQPDDTINVLVLRDGKERTLTVTLAAYREAA